jgi:hypothetical protein
VGTRAPRASRQGYTTTTHRLGMLTAGGNMLCTSSASRWPELLAPGGVATAASVTAVSAGMQQQWRSHARGRGDSAAGRVGRSSRQLGRSSLALREARIMPASRRQLEQGSVMGELGDPPPRACGAGRERRRLPSGTESLHRLRVDGFTGLAR